VTDRQTDRHTTTAYTALPWRRAVKLFIKLYLYGAVCNLSVILGVDRRIIRKLHMVCRKQNVGLYLGDLYAEAAESASSV